MNSLVYSHTYSLTAGECDATSHMPVTLVAERVIEVATEHADRLGLGFANLQPRGLAWVLSRLSIEMEAWPGIGDSYTVTTWVEGFNHLVSERVFAITGADGRLFGHARSTWAAIDIEKRTAGNLSAFNPEQFIASGQPPCPVERQRKVRISGDMVADAAPYRFRWCDLDFNQHVNSVRYIEHILNMFSLDTFVTQTLRRFEIAYLAECHYGDDVEIRLTDADADGTSSVDIVRSGQTMVTARTRFLPRP